MKILFTGDYLPDYNRTTIIKNGLKKTGHEVVEFVFKDRSKKNAQQLQELAASCDFVYMPSFTHKEVPFVRKTLPSNKKIIFDPLISRYLTKVFDYKLVSKLSFSALRNFYRDKNSMHAADFVVTDTRAHLEYYNQQFGVPKEKMGVLYIGNDFDEYYPGAIERTTLDLGHKVVVPASAAEVRAAAEAEVTCPIDDHPLVAQGVLWGEKMPHIFRVGFYGGFIPLQGVMNILSAIQLVGDQKDIEFELIGSGFEFDKAKEFVKKHQLHRVRMPGWIKPPELRERIQKFDLALGIFGETEKADLVIPNKVYHYAACAKPILTKDTKAMREIFKNDENTMLISPLPSDIARAILRLKVDKKLREKLGQNAYKMLRENYDESHVAQRLIDFFSM